MRDATRWAGVSPIDDAQPSAERMIWTMPLGVEVRERQNSTHRDQIDPRETAMDVASSQRASAGEGRKVIGSSARPYLRTSK